MLRIVIQSRLSSSRLPAKAMLTLAGMPMVVLAARRAASTGVDVIVATSDAAEDDVIAATLADHDIACFRGPLDDPLERFRGATEDLNDADVVIRMTADNCVPDGRLVLDLVSAMKDDYIRTDSRLPYGVSAEAFTVRVLRDAAASAVDLSDREHVTPWIRRHTRDQSFMPDNAQFGRGIRCTVDTFDDYVRAARVLNSVEEPQAVGWRDLISIWPNQIDQGRWVLGTAQLGLDYGVANTHGLLDKASVGAVLGAAERAGVSHVDTARAYGQSESRLKDVWGGGVVTKVSPLDIHGTGDDVQSSIATSLQEMGRSSVAALLLHRWEDWIKPGVAEALTQAQGAHQTRLIGVSVMSPVELIKALDDPRIGYIQFPFNLLDRRWLADDVLVALSKRTDVLISVRSVMLQGLLAAHDGTRWPPVEGIDPAAIRTGIQRLVRELNRGSAADLCIAYVLGHPFVSAAVLGAETPEQVEDLAQLVTRAPLTSEQIRIVHDTLEAAPIELVDPARWEWK